MKYQAEIRELLVKNAIHLIAEGGFEKATTKELTHYGGDLPDCKMNEVYIYRLFGSKERLFEAVFVRLDTELFHAFKKGLEIAHGFRGDTRERFNDFFDMAWRFALRDEERCRCYVRYYYSIYFKDNSLQAHNKLFGEMISEVAPLFKEEADVRLYYIVYLPHFWISVFAYITVTWKTAKKTDLISLTFYTVWS